jgi:hypothetical protein
VIRQEQGQWTVLIDAQDNSMWWFARPSNPAFPTAVRRHIVERDGDQILERSTLCGAAAEACETMRKQFQEEDERVRDLQQRMSSDDE